MAKKESNEEAATVVESVKEETSVSVEVEEKMEVDSAEAEVAVEAKEDMETTSSSKNDLFRQVNIVWNLIAFFFLFHRK